MKILSYPNPASEIVTIENKTGSRLTYQLVNKEGILMKEIKDDFNELMLLDVHELAPGLYFLKAIGDSKIYTQKITVTHN